VELLAREGVTRGVHLVGDTMYDAVRMFTDLANQQSRALETLGLQTRRYLLATIHRPYNTDVPANLLAIMRALGQAGETIVFPVHPRTRQCLKQIGWYAGELPHVLLTDPVGYLDMLVLERNARLILTDSGGVQKEAYFFSVPCVTLRPETEWVETVQAGWNVLVDCDPRKIVEAIHRTDWPTGAPPALFGEGDSSRKIAEVLSNHAPLR
jgi:UDP-N-acetylglucosamine 2-epimerase